MRRQLLLAAAVGLACAAVLIGPADRAGADPGARPSCAGARVASGLRVFVDPGSVVAGEVVEVRSGRVQLERRPDGVWVGTVPVVTRDVHVVVKSDAPRFSQRRWSSWVTCRTVKP